MLNIIIPRSRYNLTDYPNMDERAVGAAVPLLSGPVKNITPVLIDSTISKFKICSNVLASLDEVRADGTALTPGTHYSADLANGEFSFIQGAPMIQAGQTYYMVWYGDYAINATDYIWVCGRTPSQYAGGTFYTIDGGGAWTDDLTDADFIIWGRKVGGGEEEELISNWNAGGTDHDETLRNDANHTRVAQSFTAPADSDYYITRIKFQTRRIGNPVGNAWIEIHSDQVGTQVGGDSALLDASTVYPSGTTGEEMAWTLINAEILEADATGDDSIIDDILEYILQTVIGLSSAKLDAAALAALGAAKTEVLGMYLEEENLFQTDLEQLEAGQLFKMIPKLDGTHTFTYYQAGTPAGTPHFFDQDIFNFKTICLPSAVKYKVGIEYNRNPTTQVYEYTETTSDIARYVYRSEESIVLQTFLTAGANAITVRNTYIGLLEYPPLIIEFDVMDSRGYDRLPTDKVKITCTRAPGFSGGTLDGVLFRILRVTKTGSGIVSFRCQLDTQTY